MIKINQMKMKIGHTQEQLKKKAADILHIREDAILHLEIARQSLDARKRAGVVLYLLGLCQCKG